MQIGIVGCGYVADFYMTTLVNHPELRLAGVYDRDPERRAVFCRHYNARAFDSLEALLAEPEIGLILNLTNPHSRCVVTEAALEAGEHVYSEEPLAMEYARTGAPAERAEARGLSPSGAAASMLGKARDRGGRRVRRDRVGPARLGFVGQPGPGPSPVAERRHTDAAGR